MRIGELARRTGFSRDAIRFYERNGLISAQENREETSNYNHVPRYRVPKRPIKPGADYAFTLQNSNYNWNMKVKVPFKGSKNKYFTEKEEVND